MSARTINPQPITVCIVLGRGKGAAAGDAQPAAAVAVEDAPHQPLQQHRLPEGACTAAAGAVFRTCWAALKLACLRFSSADRIRKSHTAATTGRRGLFLVVSGKSAAAAARTMGAEASTDATAVRVGQGDTARAARRPVATAEPAQPIPRAVLAADDGL
jgi:hypothetical protein